MNEVNYIYIISNMIRNQNIVKIYIGEMSKLDRQKIPQRYNIQPQTNKETYNLLQNQSQKYTLFKT